MGLCITVWEALDKNDNGLGNKRLSLLFMWLPTMSTIAYNNRYLFYLYSSSYFLRNTPYAYNTRCLLQCTWVGDVIRFNKSE